MTRDQLRRLLSGTDGEAVPLFTSLLDDSASNIDADAERTSDSTANLLAIYRRRAEHVRRIGLPTLAFDETIVKLESTRHDRLRLALGAGPGGHPSCVAFLSDDLSEVVAVLAVLGPLRRSSTHPVIEETESPRPAVVEAPLHRVTDSVAAIRTRRGRSGRFDLVLI